MKAFKITSVAAIAGILLLAAVFNSSAQDGFISRTIPFYDSKNTDKLIEIQFKKGQCCDYDSGTIILPKDTVGAIRIILKRYLKVQLELDSLRLELYKTRANQIREYERLLAIINRKPVTKQPNSR